MKKVLIDTNCSFEIEKLGSQTLINGSVIQWDMKSVSPNHFHFLLNNRSYSAELVDVNHKDKVALIKINGREYTAALKDDRDILLESMGIRLNQVAHASELKAPMPGMVLDVFVKPGDQMKKGDQLLVLEAMKMENLIKSPADFIIKSIEIEKGDKVEKNQILLKFE